jgi:hypothetical protein
MGLPSLVSLTSKGSLTASVIATGRRFDIKQLKIRATVSCDLSKWIGGGFRLGIVNGMIPRVFGLAEI